MKLIKENQTHVYGECKACGKIYKIKRSNLELSYDGYKMKHSTICSCGEIIKRIKGDIDTKHCPDCAEKISGVLIICPMCGHDFTQARVDLDRKRKRIFLISIFSFFGILMLLSGYIVTQSQKSNNSVQVVDSKLADEMEEEETGEMYLVDSEGNYLGELISDETAPNSVLNKLGDYGLENSSMSIWNANGKYGDKTSNVSAFNEYATNPPQIYYKGTFVAYVSKNSDLGKMTIDPDLLKSWIKDQGY